MQIICVTCGARYPLDTRAWVCENCRGLLEIAGAPRFDPALIDANEKSLWRYRAMLPMPDGAISVSMGEGFTPLVETRFDGATFFAKLDFLMPSGSFKDRGTTVLVSALKSFGVARVVEDSSGNAAASLAAYTARANIAADIFAPAHASPAKLAQIAIYGAHVNKIDGVRENSARAAQLAAARGDAYYASHYYNPFALAGMKTNAWEMWEQLGRRAPNAVIAPVGHGTNLLGIARGFQDLRDAGLIENLPRVFAAQAENVAPLARAFARGFDHVPATDPALTIAEGIAISRPAHGNEILRALIASRGGAIAVSEDAIAQARNDLARAGLYIEPTSATAVAAWRIAREQFTADDVVVITLTGSGLKATQS
ncbi:MAG: threonine synthase [Chloroflexi bacterium]|nr:threonine synthase [Chloroflexota bacterium]